MVLPSRFSNLDRDSQLKAATQDIYDLVIIGGGITGAGIALDASLRGLKVCLLEKEDYASGTSSKSTKLIHGGLRYLKQLEFGLVRETGTERAIAHNNICHLVHPRDMLLPIVKGGSFNAFSAGLAISIYDILAGVTHGQRKKKLSKAKVTEVEPLLRTDFLKSGIQYSEYRTDDSRLTIELIKAAKRLGSVAFNYLETTGFENKDGKIHKVVCKDHTTSATITIQTKTVINAAGPWVDNMRKADNSHTDTNVILSKGVHVVLDKQRLDINHSIYFDAFDGRMIFAIPRGQSVYVGTTDTFYYDNPDEVRCDLEDAEYLLAAVNNMFEISPITIEDIKSTWAGLRPLIKKKGKNAGELSRKDEIFVSESGLITIAGGKLTGYRKMAERVVDLAMEQQGIEPVACKTKHYKIHANPFADYQEYLQAIEALIVDYPSYPATDLRELLTLYGKDAEYIIDLAKERYNGDLVKGQVHYTVYYEGLLTAIDFLERRTGWLYFRIDHAISNTEKVILTCAEIMGKDRNWISEQTRLCNQLIAINTLKGI